VEYDADRDSALHILRESNVIESITPRVNHAQFIYRNHMVAPKVGNRVSDGLCDDPCLVGPRLLMTSNDCAKEISFFVIDEINSRVFS
jgi:hypothetical protein